MKTILLFAFCLFIIASCEKEKLVEKQTSWKQFDEYLYDEKIQVNAVTANDYLYTIGLNSFTTVASTEDSSVFGSQHTLTRFNDLVSFKMPISPLYFTGVKGYSIGFFSTRNPWESSSYIWVYIPGFDSVFSSFSFPASFSSEALVINNHNQCLIPYKYYERYEGTPIVKLEPRFIMANITAKNPAGQGIDFIDTLSCETFAYDGLLGQPIALHSFEDYFIVTGASATVKLSGDLEFTPAYDGRLYKIFEMNGILYAFSENQLLKSTDKAVSWTSVCASDPVFSQITYKVIQNRIIGYRFSQLFEIILNESGFDVEEIKNDGLEGNQITSVNFFKGKVFVTTLSGVFYKDTGKFFEYIED